MSQTTPQVADNPSVEDDTGAPRVRVLLTTVPDADLHAALAVLDRQVYEPSPGVVVVGEEDLELPDGVDQATSLDEAIKSSGPEVDYLWLLHADARPRPDALSALVSEIERNEAALAGSKLLKAGTNDELESVGGATDVFGEPYSGLDEGEIDLQQYDVVREVAFVGSASMLVRRDIAQGLKGLDPLLPPVAAGLDFSQRTRLAGGKVVTVPSSEVYHQGRCDEGGTGWREHAGRLRAMLIAYSPLTLLWVVPYDVIVSVLDSIASLLLLRWRPLVRHLFSWAWNLFHLPSTIRQRRRLRLVRSERDEELFRFHAKGSLRLRAIGEEISAKVLSLFDDDQALARGTRRLWASSGIWGAVTAVGVLAVAARSLIFTGMPNTGFSFPFEESTVALQRWFGGWNDSGLGSAAAVHPAVGLTGAISALWLGLEGAARTLMTLGLALLGVVGVGRLSGRLGVRGPGRYLAGLVLLAGPGTSLLTGRGSWLALGAAAMLPWAVRSAFVHVHEEGRSRFTLVGWAILTGALAGFFSPLLVVVPLLFVVVWKLVGGTRASLLLALSSVIGGVVSVAFLLGDPGWIYDSSRRLGLSSVVVWPVLIVAAAAPLFFANDRKRALAMTGGLVSLGSLAVSTVPQLGPGIEEALLVSASLGAAMIVAAGLDSFSREPYAIIAALGAVAILVVSVGDLGNGRLGLSSGDVNERLSFATTLADDDGPGRILHAAVDPALIPGEMRSGPGFFYRLLDGQGTTLDEVWLPEPQAGDETLAEALHGIATGADLRPGTALAPFAIDWVVLEGPQFVLDQILVAQLDLVPTPLDPQARVYENVNSSPLAGNQDIPWVRAGMGYQGEAIEGTVRIATNYHSGWSPDAAPEDWGLTVAGDDGVATFRPSGVNLLAAISTLIVVLAALSMLILGRRVGR